MDRLPVRVLMVDDVAQLRDIVIKHLHGTGRYVVVAQVPTAEEALGVLDTVCPDLVLLDLSMPGMGGVAALPQLHARRPDVKIAVFSGFEHAGRGPELLAAGADVFVQKGTPLVRLVAELDALFGIGTQGDSAPGNDAPGNSPPGNGAPGNSAH